MEALFTFKPNENKILKQATLISFPIFLYLSVSTRGVIGKFCGLRISLYGGFCMAQQTSTSFLSRAPD